MTHLPDPVPTQPLEILLDAQSSQISAWLLNYKLYVVVAGLIVLSLARPVYRWTKGMWVNVAHDYLYGVFHTIVVFPLLTLFLVYFQGFITSTVPALNLLWHPFRANYHRYFQELERGKGYSRSGLI